MKNKILLEVYLPETGETFEMRVPGNIKVRQFNERIIDYLKAKAGAYIPDDDSVICDLISGNPIDPNLYIDNAGLENGSRVMVL